MSLVSLISSYIHTHTLLHTVSVYPSLITVNSIEPKLNCEIRGIFAILLFPSVPFFPFGIMFSKECLKGHNGASFFSVPSVPRTVPSP